MSDKPMTWVRELFHCLHKQRESLAASLPELEDRARFDAPKSEAAFQVWRTTGRILLLDRYVDALPGLLIEENFAGDDL